MMHKITKEDIVPHLKVPLDQIFKAENIFKAGNFHKTNIPIKDLDRKQKRLGDYNNSKIHYEVFFKDGEQKIYVEIHFLKDAKDLFERIANSLGFPTILENSESKEGAEKIIRLSGDGIPYSHNYSDLAIEINKQLKLLKGKVEEVLNGLNRKTP